jgi:hypothetical protein
MADEPLILTHADKVVVLPPAQEQLHGDQLPIPTEEQARLADRVFTEDTRESDLMIGLLGMQAGILILHDIALETFKPLEEEARRRRPGLPNGDGPDRDRKK